MSENNNLNINKFKKQNNILKDNIKTIIKSYKYINDINLADIATDIGKNNIYLSRCGYGMPIQTIADIFIALRKQFTEFNKLCEINNIHYSDLLKESYFQPLIKKQYDERI